jgi:hypothetical protein
MYGTKLQCHGPSYKALFLDLYGMVYCRSSYTQSQDLWDTVEGAESTPPHGKRGEIFQKSGVVLGGIGYVYDGIRMLDVTCKSACLTFCCSSLGHDGKVPQCQALA